MRVYISVDIEGIATIVNSESTSAAGNNYERARRQMTAEANAAVLGALAAGATEILINDSHGCQTNLLPHELHPAAELIQGTPKPLMMMEGIDPRFDAAMFVGYHARMLQHGVLSHTISSRSVSNVWLNGQPMGETAINAAVAGYYKVPVVFVSGDNELCKEAEETLGNVETACVKHAITRVSARSLHPAKACEVIENGVQKALKNINQYKPYLPTGPYTFNLQFINAGMADAAAMMPGAVRVDGSTVSFSHTDYMEAFRGLRCMINLGA
ncbi:MAG TPA: peptidase M55 [Firmicutes bacterium]|nr:peptidase M55 [Bacillota bacterium]